MAYGLELSWVHGLTGNPNFLFFQCFVFYLFGVVIVSESLKDFLKQAKLKGLK
jgi:phosphatidylinositol glycan class U